MANVAQPRIALVLPLVALPRDLTGFSYRIPDALGTSVEPGVRVRAPFRNRTVPGVVWSVGPVDGPPATRSIVGVLPGRVSNEQRAFVASLARAHLTSPGAFPRSFARDAAANPTGASTFLAYLAAPSDDAAQLGQLGGAHALVLAAGPGARSLPERAATWIRGADAESIDPSERWSAVVVFREELPEHRRRVPPFLDTRRAALLRAAHLGTPTILTARAPRVETVAALRAGFLHPLGTPPALPNHRWTTVASWRDSNAIEAITDTVRDGASAFLWVPAAGYAAGLGCRRCGWTARCERCGVALTVPDPNHLRCAACAAESPPPVRCPRCGAVGLSPRASGSSGVRAELRRRFPSLPVAALSAGAPLPPPAFRGVLVGTHAYLDLLPRYGVRTAVVAGVERFLGIPDFRAEERFAQNLTALRWALPRGSRVLLAAQDAAASEIWMDDPRERIAALLPDRIQYLYPPAVRLVLLSGRGVPDGVDQLPGVRRADRYHGHTLLRVDPAGWDALVPALLTLPRTVTVEPDPDGLRG